MGSTKKKTIAFSIIPTGEYFKYSSKVIDRTVENYMVGKNSTSSIIKYIKPIVIDVDSTIEASRDIFSKYVETMMEAYPDISKIESVDIVYPYKENRDCSKYCKEMMKKIDIIKRKRVTKWDDFIQVYDNLYDDNK